MQVGALRRRRQGGGAVNPWGDDFVMTVRTTATPETFTIPCAAGTYNAVIDWGDGGATSTITSNIDAGLAHSYAAPGDYTVRISGIFPYIYFNNAGDKLKIITVEQMGRVGWTSIISSFYGLSNMTKFHAGNTDFTGDKSFASAFRAAGASGCDFDLSGMWAAGARPTTLSNCFYACGAASLSLAGCDFSVNASMAGAFRQMVSLTTLTLPDAAVTTACSSMNNMFFGSTTLETVNTVGWDTSAVDDFTSCFRTMGTVDIDISGFRFDALFTNTLFLSGSTLATAQYDAALIEWAGIDVPNSLSFDMGTSKYTGGGAAAAARADLVATDLWVITDGGIA